MVIGKGAHLSRPSGKTERIEALGKLCASGQILHIAQAARQLGTSEVTLRRDLAGSSGDLVCLGGYVMRAGEGPEGYSLNRAVGFDADVKAALGAQAARLIEPEDVVFIDCGSTVVHVAQRVPPNIGVTVVTQALNIAEQVSRIRGVRLMLLGGLYHDETASFSSAHSLKALEGISINKGFFSAAGVDPVAGVSSFHFHEPALKRAAFARCRNRYLVCDASKWQKLRPAIYAQLVDFDDWIGAPDGVFPAGMQAG